LYSGQRELMVLLDPLLDLLQVLDFHPEARFGNSMLGQDFPDRVLPQRF
jgi:hypothetical protein